MSILAVYRDFGSLGLPEVRRLPEGLCLSEMVARMPALPKDFGARGVICLNGHPVPRAVWPILRPKPEAHGVPVEITFHQPPMGGGGGEGGGKGKNILAIVASIALTVVTGFIAGGGLATKLGWSARFFGAGKIGALAMAAGVSLAGSLLISALVPPPTVQQGRSIRNPGSASADGNTLEANATVPRVIGERRVYPPLAAEPFTYFDGPDEIVEAVYVLAGPHRINDIRVGSAPIGTLTDVEYEVREGWPGDAALRLARRQTRTEAVQAELRGHSVDDSDGVTLDSTTGDITSALPQIQTIATRDAPDEHQLHIILPQGLHRNSKETDKLQVPFRLRIRPLGASEWINLPELHFQAANLRQIRATIRILWADDATVSPGAASGEGWVEARRRSPGQSAAPAVADFVADSYFHTGAGDDYMNAMNLGSTGVAHTILMRHEAMIVLDRAVFAPGRYEVEIRRGTTILSSTYSPAAYTVSGSVWDLFGYRGTPGVIAQSRNGIADTVYLLRSVSLWNSHPLPTDAFAAVAVRARNRAMERVSMLAGGWVKDWDGSGWRAWSVTSNPAPHLRDIYAGAQNLDPVPADLIDDAGLVSWRSDCVASGYQCNALIEGQTVDEAARIVASCGYARPYMAETWGVVQDKDRSAETPVQIFTPRNSAGFSWRKAFARVPDGFRVNFRDASRDYDSRQITVFRPGITNDTGLLEQVTYEGLVTEAEVTAKARYDQAQARLRSTYYTLDAPAEAIVCRRGSLVGVTHHSLTAQAGSARLVGAELDGAGMVTALHVDGDMPMLSQPDMLATADLLAVPDLLLVGAETGVAIRRPGGVTVHPVMAGGAASGRIELAAPIAATGIVDADGNIAQGLLIAVGPLGEEYLRLIVFQVTPRPGLEASLTLVDEAPELWS